MKHTSPPTTAIVILNYNGAKLLTQYLPIVIDCSPSWSSIIVADNGSSDNSLAILQQHFPSVKIISLGRNYGFAQGYNLALQQIQADYCVLLNSDVKVTPSWLEPLIDTMESNEKIFACQPKILSLLHPSHFEYAGAAGGFIDWLGYPFCRGRLFSTLEKDEGQYDQPARIFWASGACMVVRTKLFKQLGGFDEDFFAHMEEVDLCWRAKNAGYEVVYCPFSRVYHLGGSTLDYQSPRKTYLNFRNSLIALIKNEKSKKVWLKVFLRMSLDEVAGVYFLALRQWAHLWAVLRSHLYVYVNVRKLLRKRYQTQLTARCVNHPEQIKTILVWAYFVKGVRRFTDLI
ncbi:MAG: glycosyltransferase family 2 protein [Cytophagales bacterium]|nr:glycosyltransferase family 2 protein [Bernardetiaceae bacterium]MDW8211720.1 glycosyltransferase family 2 protein [Cytophagales bacterium]